MTHDFSMTNILDGLGIEPGSHLLCFCAEDSKATLLTFTDDPLEPSHEAFEIQGSSVRFRVCEGDNKGLDIVLTKMATGVWSAGVARLEHGEELPGWHISFATDGISEYSTMIAIGAPDTAQVAVVENVDER